MVSTARISKDRRHAIRSCIITILYVEMHVCHVYEFIAEYCNNVCVLHMCVLTEIRSPIEKRCSRSQRKATNEPRSKLPAIDFSIRWNLFFKKLNGVTRAQAFHKLRASSCTRKLRASPKTT